MPLKIAIDACYTFLNRQTWRHDAVLLGGLWEGSRQVGGAALLGQLGCLGLGCQFTIFIMNFTAFGVTSTTQRQCRRAEASRSPGVALLLVPSTLANHAYAASLAWQSPRCGFRYRYRIFKSWPLPMKHLQPRQARCLTHRVCRRSSVWLLCWPGLASGTARNLPDR